MMMNSKPPRLTLGYDLDAWTNFGEKEPVTIDISPSANSHILLCGMSGSGKSYLEHQLLYRLILAERERGGEYIFADYKQDDSFFQYRACPRYFPYRDTLTALDIVHGRLLARQSGEDTSRNPITIFWDEYMAQALFLLSEDKKVAASIMGKVSEILMLGRSLGPIRITISCQRPDALAFPAGSRLNLGIIVILGGAVRSIYDMLMPEFWDDVKGRQFGRGEGVVLLQGSTLRYIKVPTVRDENRMRQVCLDALSRE